MSRLLLGTICGLIYGLLSAASMLPLTFVDKTAALTGAFLNRFVIGAARLAVPGWANGLIFGILLSLPDAIITKACAPILILGAIGGLIIGLIVNKWGHELNDRIENERSGMAEWLQCTKSNNSLNRSAR